MHRWTSLWIQHLEMPSGTSALPHHELLMQKGVYPYEYMNDFARFDETSLPPPSEFYSKLSNEHITDSAYKRNSVHKDSLSEEPFATPPRVVYSVDARVPVPTPFSIHSARRGIGVLTTSLLQRWWNTNHFPRRLAFFDDVLRVFLHKLKGLEPFGLGYLKRHRTII